MRHVVAVGRKLTAGFHVYPTIQQCMSGTANPVTSMAFAGPMAVRLDLWFRSLKMISSTTTTEATVRTKLRQVTVRMECRMCKREGYMWSTYLPEGDVMYHCAFCQKTWSVRNTDACQFRNFKTERGQCLCIFFGVWTIKEQEAVKLAFQHSCKGYDEWSFFKGCHVFTAWKGSHNFLLSKTLSDLVDKVRNAMQALT